MNKLIVIFISFIISYGSIYSQLLPGDVKSNSVKPKKNSDDLSDLYYIGIAAKGAKSLDNWGLDAGIQIGGFLSEHFSLGGAFYYLLTHNIQILPDEPYFLQLTYGGLEPKFLFKFSHFSINTKILIGFGFSGYSQSTNFDVLSDLDGNWLFLTEPALGISINLSDKLWIDLDAGYRITSKIDSKLKKDFDLNGTIFSITLRTNLN